MKAILINWWRLRIWPTPAVRAARKRRKLARQSMPKRGFSL